MYDVAENLEAKKLCHFRFKELNLNAKSENLRHKIQNLIRFDKRHIREVDTTKSKVGNVKDLLKHYQEKKTITHAASRLLLTHIVEKVQTLQDAPPT